MLITRRLEFDAGHRIPDHKSQCRNLHGHRYAIEITVSGDITRIEGTPSNGMVVDFSELKSLIKELVVDRWDHAFLVYQEDTAVLAFLNSLPNHKTVSLDRVPTAENLAQIAYSILASPIAEICGKSLTLENVRLYETPNCWADARR